VSLSEGALTAFLLLSPGFAVFIACFGKDSNDRAWVERESTNSALVVSIVGVGSLLGHLLWALVCWANGLAVTAWGAHIPALSAYSLHDLMFRTNIVVREGDVLAAALSTVAMVGFTFALALWFARSDAGRRMIDPLRYGWAADVLAKARTEGRFVTAFVLTSMESDGTFLGYEGVLEGLNLDAKKQIASISLRLAGRFLVSVSRRGVVRTSVRSDLIPQLYIDSTSIKNVAFNVFQLKDRMDANRAAVEAAAGQKVAAGVAPGQTS